MGSHRYRSLRFVTGDIQALLFVLVGLPHFCGGGRYLTPPLLKRLRDVYYIDVLDVG